MNIFQLVVNYFYPKTFEEEMTEFVSNYNYYHNTQSIIVPARFTYSIFEQNLSVYKRPDLIINRGGS